MVVVVIMASTITVTTFNAIMATLEAVLVEVVAAAVVVVVVIPIVEW